MLLALFSMAKKGEMGELLRIILWIALFVLLLSGVYLMFRRLG
jgi:hypothetical protein